MYIYIGRERDMYMYRRVYLVSVLFVECHFNVELIKTTRTVSSTLTYTCATFK